MKNCRISSGMRWIWSIPGMISSIFIKKGVSKASALRILCRQWKIGMGETAAFGNSENDVSMLREAGWSYAVSNAEPAALAAARFHIESNDRDGVARVLETFL